MKKLSSIPKIEDRKAIKQIIALLSDPLEKYSNVVTALTLSNYPCVMNYLDHATNKVMAMVIIQSILKNETHISAADKVCNEFFVSFKTFSSKRSVSFISFVG